MSVNKVILVGRLGRDPEVRYMPNGEAVCNFSIATDESWNNKQTGEKVTKTEWHNIVFYRRIAEVAGQCLKKGSQVYIEGKIQSEKYTGKDGVERTAYKIIGSEMKMLGGKNDSSGGAQDGYTPPPPPQSRGNAYAAAKNGTPLPTDDIDDDIPF